MSMLVNTLVNTVSAIGNNSSIYPLLVRDCGIEAPTKVTQTYLQNKKESDIMAKHAARERIIDEYGASAIWLGGIPAVEAICNKVIDRKGLSSKINYKLFENDNRANKPLEKVTDYKLFGKKIYSVKELLESSEEPINSPKKTGWNIFGLKIGSKEEVTRNAETINQGVNINIERFKNLSKENAPKNKRLNDAITSAIEDLKTAKPKENLFRKMTVNKYTAAIAIPVALMGFVLPKSNFALTRYLFKKDAEKGLIPQKYLEDKNYLKNDTKVKPAESERFVAQKYNNYSYIANIQNNQAFSVKNTNNYSPSFKGFASFMTGLSQQEKMAMTDGGLGIGRVTTSRRKNEAIENGFRMAGMMYLNFVAPKQIEKLLDKGITKTFGINPELDPKILYNKRFLAKVKYNELELPKSKEEVLDFIDKNPKSLFNELTSITGDVKYLPKSKNDRRLIRDPRCYVDTEKVFELAEKMRAFSEGALNPKNVKKYGKKAVRKYANKALGVKSANILTNVAVSSALLAFALPQAQFALRKLLFKSDVDPGLV